MEILPRLFPLSECAWGVRLHVAYPYLPSPASGTVKNLVQSKKSRPIQKSRVPWQPHELHCNRCSRSWQPGFSAYRCCTESRILGLVAMRIELGEDLEENTPIALLDDDDLAEFLDLDDDDFNDLLLYTLRSWGFQVEGEGRFAVELLEELRVAATCGEVVRILSAPSAPEGAVQALLVQNEDMQAARRAWEIEYVVPDLALDLVAATLERYADSWNREERYAPMAALLQSSGWGKSRLVCQLWRKNLYVVYISCMPKHKSGFPRRTAKLADVMQDEGCRESDFVALVMSILTIVNKHAGSKGPKDWMGAQEADDSIQTEIYDMYCEIREQVAAKVPARPRCRATDIARYYKDTEQHYNGLYLPEIQKLKQRDVKVLLCVDEAGEVGEGFEKFRRSLRGIPTGNSFFTLMLGTDQKVVELACPDTNDPSARTRDVRGRLQTYAPMHLIGKSDILVDARTSAANSSSGTADSNATDILRVIRHGRPLWAAYLDSCDSGEKLRVAIDLAKVKLLGGKVSTAGKDWVTRERAVAVLGCIVGLDVVAWGTLPQELVARHMRTLVHISQDRRRVYTAAAAEPLLAIAAAELLHKSLEAFLDRLIEVCMDGLVLEGVRGEIVARLVIMLAMHDCTRSKNYAAPVPLEGFLRTMFGEQIVTQLKANGAKMSANVFFNSFTPTTVEPSPGLLDDCYQRCTALICKRNESVMDFALPASGDLPGYPENDHPLHHRIRFPGQVKNGRNKSQSVVASAVERIQEDNRLDAPLELLFQVGWRSAGVATVEGHTVVVRGLDAFHHLGEDTLTRVKLLATTCEDVFDKLPPQEKAVLKELLPLVF